MTGSMQWIRDHYPVPARRGMRVVFYGQPATIVDAVGGHLRLRLDGQRRLVTVHPMWRIEYLPGETP